MDCSVNLRYSIKSYLFSFINKPQRCPQIDKSILNGSTKLIQIAKKNQMLYVLKANVNERWLSSVMQKARHVRHLFISWRGEEERVAAGAGFWVAGVGRGGGIFIMTSKVPRDKSVPDGFFSPRGIDLGLNFTSYWFYFVSCLNFYFYFLAQPFIGVR